MSGRGEWEASICCVFIVRVGVQWRGRWMWIQTRTEFYLKHISSETVELHVHSVSWLAWVHLRGSETCFRVQPVKLSTWVFLDSCCGIYVMRLAVDSHELSCIMFTWLKSFFYVHNISKHDEQNSSNLESAQFDLKHVSSKQVTSLIWNMFQINKWLTDFLAKIWFGHRYFRVSFVCLLPLQA